MVPEDELTRSMEFAPIEQELIARSDAAEDAGTPMSMEQLQAEYQRILAERHQRLKQDAEAVFRAMEGWDLVKNNCSGRQAGGMER